jgi:Fe2+ or Zn2+ uptake regulation protein
LNDVCICDQFAVEYTQTFAPTTIRKRCAPPYWIFVSTPITTICDVAKKVGSTAHLATIYRTLEKLATANLLTRVDFQEGKFRYEYVHDHHHHAVCEGCGKVAEVQDDKLENMMDKIKVEKGFSITRHALELFGLCRSCQQKG